MFSNLTFLLMLLMGTVVLIWSMYLIHSKNTLREHTEYDELSEKPLSEPKTIRIAAKSGGRISVAALCMKANVSTETAKTMLESLQEKGVFELVVSEEGAVYYELTDKDLVKNN